MRSRPVAGRALLQNHCNAGRARARNAFAPRPPGLWRRELCAFDGR